MKKRNRILLSIGVVLLAGCFFACNLSAKDYPEREISLLLPYSPGGPIDLTARVLAEEAGKVLGQSVVPVNQAGGGGILAQSILKTKKPDGYNISVSSLITFVGVPQMRKVPFDPLKDFEFIIHYLAIRGGIVTRADSQWKSMKELVDYSKKHPGDVTYACPGAGNASNLAMEAIAKKEGNLKLRMVPYKGSIDCVTALMGGHVDLAVSDAAPWKDLVKAGKLRCLAVEDELRPYVPNVQTWKELGYTVTAGGQFGVIGLKGTNPQILKILHDAFKSAMETANFKNACEKIGVFPVYLPPKEYEALVRQTYVEVGRLVKELGMATKTE